MSSPIASPNGAKLVALRGRLDAAAVTELRRTLRSPIEQGDSRLALDFGEVTMVDSSGLSVLVSAMKAAREAGGDVVIVRPSPTVKALLELTRLDQIFALFEDEAAALAHLNA